MPVVAGIDEAGRGPLAGPVVAAAVVIPDDVTVFREINDSKKLSPVQREKLYTKITENYFWAVGIVSEKEIDRINILQATFKAMAIALKKLKVKPEICLIDGNLKNPLIILNQRAVVKGDAKYKVIGAASIIAKVTRDRIMVAYAEKYPEYGFDKHKGYGTKMHVAALNNYGRCPIHRVSFTYPQLLS